MSLAGLLALLGGAVLHADPLTFPDPFNLLNQPRLAGEFWGYRPKVETNGVVLTAQSISDLLGNTTGGAATGTTYSGLLNLGLTVDLEKAAGWEGASFKSSWLWLYGRDLTANYLGNALTVSSIAGTPAFRADELWFQQNCFHDALSIRAGQLSLDTEFMTSDTAALFVNSTFGTPALFTQNNPNGGAVYPLVVPGVRLAIQPKPWLTIRSSISQANPFAQTVNRNGFYWNFGPNGGLLSLNEAAATWSCGTHAGSLSGTGKMGFWVQNSQAPLAANIPTSAYSTGFYAGIDQQLYAAPPTSAPPSPSNGKEKQVVADASCACSGKGLSAFARTGFSPQQTSQTSFYADSGVVYTGLVPTRDQDKLGLAIAYNQFGKAFANESASDGYPASFEAVAELSYAMQISQAILIQPDLQYILHPGGTQQYGNALVIGVRAVVNF